MNTIYILILIVTSVGRPAATTVEFNSATACEFAKQSVRSKIQDGAILLLTCEKK